MFKKTTAAEKEKIGWVKQQENPILWQVCRKREASMRFKKKSVIQVKIISISVCLRNCEIQRRICLFIFDSSITLKHQQRAVCCGRSNSPRSRQYWFGETATETELMRGNSAALHTRVLPQAADLQTKREQSPAKMDLPNFELHYELPGSGLNLSWGLCFWVIFVFAWTNMC